jgi:hypothetical protein
MAIGDFDNDGAPDVLVAVNNAAPVPLRNTVGAKHHWLGVRLVGKKANIDEDSHAAVSLCARDRHFGEPRGL